MLAPPLVSSLDGGSYPPASSAYPAGAVVVLVVLVVVVGCVVVVVGCVVVVVGASVVVVGASVEGVVAGGSVVAVTVVGVAGAGLRARGAGLVGTAGAAVVTTGSAVVAGAVGVVVAGAVATLGGGAGCGRRGEGRLMAISPPTAMSTNGSRTSTIRRWARGVAGGLGEDAGARSTRSTGSALADAEGTAVAAMGGVGCGSVSSSVSGSVSGSVDTPPSRPSSRTKSAAARMKEKPPGEEGASPASPSRAVVVLLSMWPSLVRATYPGQTG
ncbi:MAG: hypothetical protein M3P85_03385 [Actinomycetota bacterium]|nr:hypothetical protein [Actinomycetota bacterium]